MIRTAIVFLLFLFGGFFSGLYIAYDDIDPCRALAVERARRAPVPTGLAQIWTEIATARMDRLTCSRDLMQSWRERLRNAL